jgi:hypothetical protein
METVKASLYRHPPRLNPLCVKEPAQKGKVKISVAKSYATANITVADKTY